MKYILYLLFPITFLGAIIVTAAEKGRADILSVISLLVLYMSVATVYATVKWIF